MSYYSDLDGTGRIKFELLNRLLNTVREAAGKPLVIFYEIEEKAPFGTAIPQRATYKASKL